MARPLWDVVTEWLCHPSLRRGFLWGSPGQRTPPLSQTEETLTGWCVWFGFLWGHQQCFGGMGSECQIPERHTLALPKVVLAWEAQLSLPRYFCCMTDFANPVLRLTALYTDTMHWAQAVMQALAGALKGKPRIQMLCWLHSFQMLTHTTLSNAWLAVAGNTAERGVQGCLCDCMGWFTARAAPSSQLGCHKKVLKGRGVAGACRTCHFHSKTHLSGLGQHKVFSHGKDTEPHISHQY